MATSYSQQVVRSFLWQGGAQTVGQTVSWLATIVVIRFLSPADYGLMAMANVFLGFFFLFADLGFGAATIQASTLERDAIRRMFGIVLITHFGGCALMLVMAPLAADFFHEPRLALVIRVLSLNFLLVAAYTLPQAQVVREMDFRTKARIDMLAVVPAAVIALALAVAGFGVWALVAGGTITHAVKAIGYNLVRPLSLTPLLSWDAMSGLAQFGALVTLDRLLFFMYGQADIVIGGRVLGKEAIGLYAVALSLAVIPMEKILPVITQVAFAAFSRIQADVERVRRNVLRAVQLISLACFPAFLGMAAVAGDLIPVVLGPQWVGMILPFQLLCLTLPLKAVNTLFAPAILAVGHAGLNAANTAVALVIMTAGILVGVQYGVIGLCLAWVIAYPIVFLVTSWRSLRILGIPYSDFLSRCAFPTAASIVMAAGVLALRAALAPLGVSAIRLALLVTAGAVMYGGFVLLLQRPAVRDLVAVVRN